MNAIMAMENVNLSFKSGARSNKSGTDVNTAYKQVLNNLSFAVMPRETFGFLGPSGAGKTTTIKLLTRQLKKDSGSILLFQRPIEEATSADYERIGILSDTSALYERMSIEDNLKFYAKVRGVSSQGIPALLKRMALFDERKTLIKKCSKGMRQRAALLAAFIHSPELLFLDEPTSGLDPAARAEVHRMLKELQDDGTTIFLTTHDMSEADAICDRIAILDQGHVVACDTPQELKLAHARNTITILTKTQGVVTTTKDEQGAVIISQLLEQGECLSIHSDEPNLEEVFLDLTGREF